jgi:hypothetical protein
MKATFSSCQSKTFKGRNKMINNINKLQKTIFFGFLFLLSLIIPSFAESVQAATQNLTTISVIDLDGRADFAKVVVFDAKNGRQIANGLADPSTGFFTFQSLGSKELIVTVHTITGYIKSECVQSGSFTTIIASEIAGETQTVGIIGSEVMMTFQNESGAPIVGANVSVAAWGSFEKVERGTTDKQGQFTFRIPKDMTEDDFLATMWQDNGDVKRVAAVHQVDHTHPQGGGIWIHSGFPTFGSVE